MGKFQIFPDGRAAGLAPVSGSDFVTKDYLASESVAVNSASAWVAKRSASLESSASIWMSGTGQRSARLIVQGHPSGSDASGMASMTIGGSTTSPSYANTASGNYSFAQGLGAKALADGTYAQGRIVEASGQYSHAEGSGSRAHGIGSHAEGSNTLASGNYSHAEGYYTTASNLYEHAQGRYNVTASNQIFSIGVGFGNTTRRNAISIITGSGATPSASIYVYGVGTYNGTNPTPGTNDIATVISNLTGSIASASYSSTDKKIYFFNAGGTASAEIDATDFIKDGMVDSVEVSGSYLVLTFNTDAGKEPVSMSLTRIFNPDNFYTKTDVDTLLSTMSVGDVNVIEAVEFNGTASTINNKTASISVELPAAPNQDAENWVTYNSASLKSASNWVANNSASLVTESVWVRGTGSGSAILPTDFGHGDSTAGKFAVAHGDYVKASGQGSHAEGRDTVASGSFSHAEGESTLAVGQVSHAEGEYTTASAVASHAEGHRTTTSGYCSHAEGSGSIASGETSHAEGNRTSAIGARSHAEGLYTTASGYQSHAEGSRTFASGAGAHTEGSGSIALGNYSHAEGYRTIASNIHEHAQGKNNATASNQIFSVGVGDAEARRKNAISIITGSGEQSSASVYIYGVGTYNGQNPQPGVNDVATVISGLGGITEETDPIYLADSASLKDAANWVGANSGALAATASWDTAASQSHTHSNGSLLNSLTNAKTGSWDGAATSATALNNISASLIASGTLAKNVTAITASLVASASVAKTASSSVAAISAKTGSWDALVGLPTVTAADNGKILRVVNGAWALVDPVTVYSGQGAPDSALGQDGDIYLQS